MSTKKGDVAVTYWRRLDLLYLGVFITEKVFICGTYPIAIFNGSLVTCKESFKLNLDDAVELGGTDDGGDSSSGGSDVIVLGVVPRRLCSRQADRLVFNPKPEFVRFATRVLQETSISSEEADAAIIGQA